MTERVRRGLVRLLEDHRVRFLAVGGTNTVVGYTLFALFDQMLFVDLRYGYLLSLVCSYALALTLAFNLYRRFVFKVKGQVVRDFVEFLGVNAVAVAANAALLPVLVEVAHLPRLVAQAVALVVTTLISYFGHREVSFRRDEAPVVSSEAAPTGSKPQDTNSRQGVTGDQ